MLGAWFREKREEGVLYAGLALTAAIEIVSTVCSHCHLWRFSTVTLNTVPSEIERMGSFAYLNPSFIWRSMPDFARSSSPR